jgi:hypothetical protein
MVMTQGYDNGNGHSDTNGHGDGGPTRTGAAGAVPIAAAIGVGGDPSQEIPYVSPLRADARPPEPVPTQSITPAEPIPTYREPAALERLAPDRDEEPALPDEARDRMADAAAAATSPVDAAAGAVLHVRFAGGAAAERLVGAMEAFKNLLIERPGSTRVVLHVPSQSGSTALPMELRRGVAYDAELLAEVRRRLGEGLVELSLG